MRLIVIVIDTNLHCSDVHIGSSTTFIQKRQIVISVLVGSALAAVNPILLCLLPYG